MKLEEKLEEKLRQKKKIDFTILLKNRNDISVPIVHLNHKIINMRYKLTHILNFYTFYFS